MAEFVIAYGALLLFAKKFGVVVIFYRRAFDLFPPGFNLVLAFTLFLSAFSAFGLGLSILANQDLAFSALQWGAIYIGIDVLGYTMTFAYLVMRYWFDVGRKT